MKVEQYATLQSSGDTQIKSSKTSDRGVQMGAAQSGGQRSTAEQYFICPVILSPQGRPAMDEQGFSGFFAYVYTHKCYRKIYVYTYT